MNDQPQRSNRRQLVIILVIATLSLGGSYLLFYSASSGGLWGTVNQGEFVDPPLQSAELSLSRDDGAPFETGDTWWLWVVANDACTSACEDAVLNMRQLQILLAKDASRVQRALVSRRLDPGMTAIAQDFPKLVLIQGERAAALADGIYIVDPRGFLALRYRYDQAGKPVLDDLKRLLKVSHIG